MVTPTEEINMSNRIKIECHSCGREFTKLIPKEERKGEHLLRCPFGDCKVESKIVFDASDVVEVFKSQKR
jgi:uncharacterized Zn finger protein